MMVIYQTTKFEFEWAKCFRVRVWKRKMLTDRRRTHQSNRAVVYTQPA